MATILRSNGDQESLTGTGEGNQLGLDDLFPIVGGCPAQLRNTSDQKVRLLFDPDAKTMCKSVNPQATALAQTYCGFTGTVYGDAIEVSVDDGDKWY